MVKCWRPLVMGANSWRPDYGWQPVCWTIGTTLWISIHSLSSFNQHNSKVIKSKLVELNGIELLPHQAHCSGLAPSDYHLFWSQCHFLMAKKCNLVTDVESGNPWAFAVPATWMVSEMNLKFGWQVVENHI